MQRNVSNGRVLSVTFDAGDRDSSEPSDLSYLAEIVAVARDTKERWEAEGVTPCPARYGLFIEALKWLEQEMPEL